MAGQWQSMMFFAFVLPNHPGELARFLGEVHAAGIDLAGLWGYAEGEENPRISCACGQPDELRALLEGKGVSFEEGRTFYFSGANEPGALVMPLEKIGEAGINVEAIETVAANGRFGCFLWTDERHWEALEKVLM